MIKMVMRSQNQSNTQAFVWIKETVCLADVSENSVS